jgi:hypothetical protein
MNTYHFGQLVPTFNVFAHPRTGSHFLFHCLSGLFDVIAFSHAHLHEEEAVDRKRELNPEMVHLLELRDPKVPWCPVFFNPTSTGIHGLPVVSEVPAIVLIRDPIAAAYSRFRVERDRWGGVAELSTAWLNLELQNYTEYYGTALAVLKDPVQSGLLVRWEHLVADKLALERIIAFCQHPAKLPPSFVYSITRFENFVQPGSRTFYRSGSNEAWHSDVEWIAALSNAEHFAFESFGYPSIADRLSAIRMRG